MKEKRTLKQYFIHGCKSVPFDIDMYVNNYPMRATSSASTITVEVGCYFTYEIVIIGAAYYSDSSSHLDT